jgi:hypothetical protein
MQIKKHKINNFSELTQLFYTYKEEGIELVLDGNEVKFVHVMQHHMIPNYYPCFVVGNLVENTFSFTYVTLDDFAEIEIRTCANKESDETTFEMINSDAIDVGMFENNNLFQLLYFPNVEENDTQCISFEKSKFDELKRFITQFK